MKKNNAYIRSNIVKTNIFHYFKRKIAVYVINVTKNPSIFKIKRAESMHFVTSSVYLHSSNTNNRWLTTNQIDSFQRIVV